MNKLNSGNIRDNFYGGSYNMIEGLHQLYSLYGSRVWESLAKA